MLTKFIVLLNNNLVNQVNDLNQIFMVEIEKILTASPMIAITLFLALLSGHLWTYIHFAYSSKKEKNFLNNRAGKVALGLAWFALVLFPIYMMTYRKMVTPSNLEEVIYTALVVAFALEFLAFFIVGILDKELKKEKGKKDAKDY